MKECGYWAMCRLLADGSKEIQAEDSFSRQKNAQPQQRIISGVGPVSAQHPQQHKLDG